MVATVRIIMLMEFRRRVFQLSHCCPIFAANLARLLGSFLKFHNLRDFGQFFPALVLES
jgi:hypothetical protein